MAGQRSMPDLISTLRIMVDQSSITRVNGALNTIRGTTVSPKVDVAPMKALDGVMLTAEQHMTSLIGSSQLGSTALQVMGNSGMGLGNALKSVEGAIGSMSTKVTGAKAALADATLGVKAAGEEQAAWGAIAVEAHQKYATASAGVAAATQVSTKAQEGLTAAKDAMAASTTTDVAVIEGLAAAETTASSATFALDGALVVQSEASIVAANADRTLAAADDQVAVSKGLLSKATNAVTAALAAMTTAEIVATAGLVLVIGAIAALAMAGSDGEKKMASFADSIYQMQTRIGTSAKESSALIDTFGMVGISANAASMAFYRMQMSAARGSAQFKQYGMALATDTKGNIDWTASLGNAADAYTKAEKAGKGAAAAQAIFGLQGKNLIPMLAEGKKGVEDMVAAEKLLGPSMDDSQVTQMEADKAAQKALDEQAQTLGLTFGQLWRNIDHGNGIMGILTGLTKEQTASLNAGIGAAVGNFTAHWNLVDAWKAGTDAGDKEKRVIDAVAQSLKDQEKNAEAAAAANKQATATLSLIGAQESLASANDVVAKSADKITAANNALADAQKNMAHDGVSDIQKLAKAYDAQIAAQLKAIAVAQTSADKQDAARLKEITTAQTLADKQDAAAIKAIDEQIKQKDQAFQLLQTKQQIANINDKLAGDEADIALASYQGNYAEAAKLNKTLTTDKQTQAMDAARTQLDADKNAADAQKQQIQDAATARKDAATAETQQIQDAATARKDASAIRIQQIQDAKTAQDQAYTDEEAKATRQKDLALAVKTAQEAVTQALEDQQKAYEDVATKATDVWKLQQEAAGQTIAETDVLAQHIIQLNQVLSSIDPNNPVYAKLNDVLYQLGHFGATPPSASTPTSAPTGSFVSGGHGNLMAAGGDLAAGQAAVVGDQGWELFVPKVAGTIIPHDQSVAAMNAGTSGGSSGSAGTQPGGGDVHYHIAVTAPNYYGPEAQLGELIIAKVSELHHRI